MIENFETFVRYEDAVIKIDYTSPLLLFRGDATNPSDGVVEFLRHSTTPVVCWPDFDPAGLQIAATLPRCAGILAPAEPAGALKNAGREDLFLGQLRELKMLKLTGESAALETALRSCCAGLDQEHMIAKQTPLRLWLT